MEKECIRCKKVFKKPLYVSLKNWEIKRKYCSKKCADADKIGKKIHTEEHKKKLSEKWKGNKLTVGVSPWNKGKKDFLTKEQRDKISESNTGEKSPMWKGEKAGSRAIHQWVERQLGKAKEHQCIICKKVKAKNWSNKNHKYSRNLEDWQPLCCRCHQKHDIKNNNKFKGIKINFN